MSTWTASWSISIPASAVWMTRRGRPMPMIRRMRRGCSPSWTRFPEPWNNPSAWSDKLNWVKRHLGDKFKKRLILSHHKDLVIGDFLIDDWDKHGTSDFQGKWIRFGSPEFPDWDAVEAYLA